MPPAGKTTGGWLKKQVYRMDIVCNDRSRPVSPGRVNSAKLHMKTIAPGEKSMATYQKKLLRRFGRITAAFLSKKKPKRGNRKIIRNSNKGTPDLNQAKSRGEISRHGVADEGGPWAQTDGPGWDGGEGFRGRLYDKTCSRFLGGKE